LEQIKLPNIRKLFIPDPGYLIADADLSGADAQVVAWEAEDEDLKAAFRAGMKIHHKNATELFGEDYVNAEPQWKKRLYQQCKAAVHLTNYGGSGRTLAKSQGWTTREATNFQERWFHLHPGIKQWHRSVERSLAETRGVVNKFGFRHTFFDRIDAIFPEALAYIPQSSVAITCTMGAINVRELYGVPEVDLPTGGSIDQCVEFLIQVHDSVVFQIPLAKKALLPDIVTALHIPIPYDDPLTIPWEVKTSEKSWGDCK